MSELERHVHENTHSRIGEVEGRAGVERSEPGGRAELVAGGAPLPGGSRLDRELSEELVDQAIDRVRGGLPVGELPDELRERLTDGLIDELLAGKRGEAEILGPGRAARRSDAPAGGARAGAPS